MLLSFSDILKKVIDNSRNFGCSLADYQRRSKNLFNRVGHRTLSGRYIRSVYHHYLLVIIVNNVSNSYTPDAFGRSPKQDFACCSFISWRQDWRHAKASVLWIQFPWKREKMHSSIMQELWNVMEQLVLSWHLMKKVKLLQNSTRY